jgi:hypothetical protein
MELELGTLLLRCDRGMFELFAHTRPEPVMRCPVRWLAVAVAFDGRGRGKTRFGTVRSAEAPLYGRDAGALAHRYIPVRGITQDQEPHLLAFLSTIAERYGRRLTAG